MTVGCRFPTKKKRHLTEHENAGVPLTWQRAGPLFEFVLPGQHEVPAFDDVVTNVVSADAVQLFNRMSELVPESSRISASLDCKAAQNCFPHGLFSAANDLAAFQQYLLQTDVVGHWPVLPERRCTAADRWTIGEMNYLLGDYLFKTGDFANAVDRYWRYLITVGPSGTHVFNAWGGSALAGAAVLLQSKLQARIDRIMDGGLNGNTQLFIAGSRFFSYGHVCH